MWRFSHLLVLAFTSFPVIGDDLSEFPATVKHNLTAYINDSSFECSRTSKPSIVTFGDFKACVGTVVCKYQPKEGAAKSLLPKDDYADAYVCKVAQDGTCSTSFKECSAAKLKGEPGTVGAGVALVPKRVAKGERSQKFGLCKYPFDGFAGELNGKYGENDFEVVCATPFKCEGGPEAPPVTVAACEPDYFVKRMIEDPKTKVTKERRFPVCAGPVTCLEKSLKVELASDVAANAKAVGAIPHGQQLGTVEAYASTVNGRPVKGEPASLTHESKEPRI